MTQSHPGFHGLPVVPSPRFNSSEGNSKGSLRPCCIQSFSKRHSLSLRFVKLGRSLQRFKLKSKKEHSDYPLPSPKRCRIKKVSMWTCFYGMRGSINARKQQVDRARRQVAGRMNEVIWEGNMTTVLAPHLPTHYQLEESCRHCGRWELDGDHVKMVLKYNLKNIKKKHSSCCRAPW